VAGVVRNLGGPAQHGLRQRRSPLASGERAADRRRCRLVQYRKTNAASDPNRTGTDTETRSLLRLAPGPVSLAVCLGILAGLPSAVVAQDAAAGPNWEVIRRSALAAIDRRTTQVWVENQVQSLLNNDNPEQLQTAGAAFYTELLRHYTARDSTADFKNGLAEIVAGAFSQAYQSTAEGGKAPQPLGTAMVLLVLRDFGHRASLPCFQAALADSTPAPRLVAAEGLAGLRDGLNEQEWTAIVPEVQRAAGREINPVTLNRLYRVLYIEVPARAEGAIAAVQGSLDARLTGFEQQDLLPLSADGEAAAWLAAKAALSTNTQTRTGVALRLGRLLANAVDIYLSVRIKEAQQEQIERAILLTEPALESLVRIVNRTATFPNPTVRDALSTGVEGRAEKMDAAVTQWVGSEEVAGVLSQPPFGFPRGLQVPHRMRTAATAPATAPATATASAPANP